MMEEFLARDEGKTLEFKENCRPLDRIVRTAVAFANTAGGTIVIGQCAFGIARRTACRRAVDARICSEKSSEEIAFRVASEFFAAAMPGIEQLSGSSRRKRIYV